MEVTSGMQQQKFGQNTPCHRSAAQGGIPGLSLSLSLSHSPICIERSQNEATTSPSKMDIEDL
jgi:hypothetical protein